MNMDDMSDTPNNQSGAVELTGADVEAIRLELRHNDLVIVPPTSLRALAAEELLPALLGAGAAVRLGAGLTLDRRHRVLRALPLRFAALKAALVSRAAYPLAVA